MKKQALNTCILFWARLLLEPRIYCKPINIGGYLIWRFLPSDHIGCYLNWLSLVVFSMKLIKVICIGGYLIWRFSGPSQIHQLKSPPNINRFTVFTCLVFKNNWCYRNPFIYNYVAVISCQVSMFDLQRYSCLFVYFFHIPDILPVAWSGWRGNPVRQWRQGTTCSQCTLRPATLQLLCSRCGQPGYHDNGQTQDCSNCWECCTKAITSENA